VDLQKKTLAATERDEEKRSAFRERLRGVDPKRLIFVEESSTILDERGAHPALRQGAQGRKGARQGAQELGQERHPHLLDQLGGDGTIHEHRRIFGHRESFGLYMRDILAPRLRPAQIVLMDNLSVHKSKWVRDLVEGRGCHLWLLPSYSPDMRTP
jgi:hypothetical protein